MTELSLAQQFVNQVFDTEVPSDTKFFIKACGVTHHSVTIDELYQFCQANNLEDERCWSTDNGEMFTEHGLHIAAVLMAESMDWNVGGITPVFVAVAWISPTTND